MNIKDDWQVRLCYKRASSRFENGNCDHKKDPFFLENTVDLIDLTFEETIGRFNEHFNGFEETIGNFQWFLRRPSPLNVFLAIWPLPPMVFQWFLELLTSLSMVFDDFGPLVKRCDGFDGSLWSKVLTFLSCSICHMSNRCHISWDINTVKDCQCATYYDLSIHWLSEEKSLVHFYIK